MHFSKLLNSQGKQHSVLDKLGPSFSFCCLFSWHGFYLFAFFFLYRSFGTVWFDVCCGQCWFCFANFLFTLVASASSSHEFVAF